MNYFTFNGKKKLGYEIITGINLIFYSILITSEVIYRIKRKTEVEFEAEEDIENITKVEFHDMVYNKGEALVILDEYVLDVGEFMHKHPGGRFVLKHNIGRDISKYFYGGYTLDGNTNRKNPRAGVVHSNVARKIVN